jgi:mRNA-degrading endonuclease RelE of RelBE toxin-antitoxin system
MPIRRTTRFDKAYLALRPSIRAKVDRAISLLDENWQHPGLRAKRLSGHRDIFYARIDRNHRITYERRGDVLILRNVGHHDETLRNP